MNDFTFGGVHTSAFDLIVNKKIIPLTPPIESRLQEISGYDGAWDYGVSFAPRMIDVECTLLADSKEDLKSKARQLAGVLNPRKGSQVLIFDDEPDKQYFARLANQIPLDQLGAMGTFTLQFICPDPFTYAKTIKTIAGGGVLSAAQLGTHIARPIITVTHGGGVGSIIKTLAGTPTQELTFEATSPSGTYVIDCKEMTIVRNGLAAYNHVKGDFFGLSEGTNVIQKSGAITNVSVVYRDTWL